MVRQLDELPRPSRNVEQSLWIVEYSSLAEGEVLYCCYAHLLHHLYHFSSSFWDL